MCHARHKGRGSPRHPSEPFLAHIAPEWLHPIEVTVMLLKSGLRSLATFLSRTLFRTRTAQRRTIPTSRLRTGIEGLERREMLTNFVVTTSLDDSTVDSVTSLREALDAANANSGADTITFDSSLSGQTIQLV